MLRHEIGLRDPNQKSYEIGLPVRVGLGQDGFELGANGAFGDPQG